MNNLAYYWMCSSKLEWLDRIWLTDEIHHEAKTEK